MPKLIYSLYLSLDNIKNVFFNFHDFDFIAPLKSDSDQDNNTLVYKFCRLCLLKFLKSRILLEISINIINKICLRAPSRRSKMYKNHLGSPETVDIRFLVPSS